jgi:hypothetical protein
MQTSKGGISQRPRWLHTQRHTHTHNTHTQAKEAYIKGAEWLGRHAALQLDRLADKILPLIKKLYRHGAPGGTAVGVGLSRPARCVCVCVCVCVRACVYTVQNARGERLLFYY